MVRHQLESFIQFGTPPSKTDTEELERIQRRATGVIRELVCIAHMEKLTEIHLFSLEKEKSGKGHDKSKMFPKENGNQLVSLSAEKRTRKSWLHLRWRRFKRLMYDISNLLFKYERKSTKTRLGK